MTNEERARELAKQLDHGIVRLTNKCTCGRPYITAIRDTQTDERLIAALLTQVQAEVRLSEAQVEAILCGDVYDINDDPDTPKLTAAINAALKSQVSVTSQSTEEPK